MQKLTRVGPYVHGPVRTIERHGEDIEELDTVRVGIASWKENGGVGRCISVAISSGPHAGLELFIPVEVFTEGQLDLIAGPGSAIIEG